MHSSFNLSTFNTEPHYAFKNPMPDGRASSRCPGPRLTDAPPPEALRPILSPPRGAELPLTRLVHAGKHPVFDGGAAVNPPVVRASTVLFESVAQQRELRLRRDGERLFTYGARGNPTNFALEDMVSELEGAYRTRLFPTGLAAIAMTLLS